MEHHAAEVEPTAKSPGHIRAALREALQSADAYQSLRQTVVHLLGEGVSREAMIAELKQFRLDELQDSTREGDDDIVCDVLDLFHGWALPELRL